MLPSLAQMVQARAVVVLVQAAGEQEVDLEAALLAMGKEVEAVLNLNLRLLQNQEEQLSPIIKMATMV